jgi:hypothetical protein
MTCVIVDAEAPTGTASATTLAASKSNFITVHVPFRRFELLSA